MMDVRMEVAAQKYTQSASRYFSTVRACSSPSLASLICNRPRHRLCRALQLTPLTSLLYLPELAIGRAYI